MRNLISAAALAFSLVPGVASAQNTGGIQTDVVGANSLDLTTVCPMGTATAQCPAGSVYEIPIGNGQGVVAVDVTGLTGSGATVMVERTVGALWTGRNLLVTGSAGAFAPSVSADASFTLNSVGSRAIRFRVSTAGTGTARIFASATANSSVIQFGTSLPAGTLTIGKTIIPDGAATSALQQSILSAIGTPLQQGGSVGITGTVPISTASPLAVTGTMAATQSGAWSIVNTAFGISGTLPAFASPPTVNIGTIPSVAINNLPATQPVSGTFFQATQPVSIAAAVQVNDAAGSLTVDTGAPGTFAITAPLPAGTNAIGTVIARDPSGDSVLDVSETPSTQASASLNPVNAVNATAVLISSTAKNLYSASITANSAAGFLVVANLSAIPASGATLTTGAGGTMLKCIAALANYTNSYEPRIPIRGTAGLVVLFSQSCTTYTPVTTAAFAIDGRAF